MRICFYSSGNSLQGGAERSQARIAQWLIERGDDVHVVLPRESELTEHYRSIGATLHVIYWQHLQKLSDPVHVLKYVLGWPIITFRLCRLLRRERIQVMHVNEILDFQGLVASRLAGVPCATYVRIILPSRLMRRVVRFIALTFANRVVCVSHATHRMALGATRHPKVQVIQNPGADPAVFNPDTVQPVSAPGAEGMRVIGMVAKLVREKGHLLLVEMAARLRDRGFTELCYVIVGGEVAGHEAYARELRDAVRDRELNDVFHFAGQQHDIAGHLAAWDIVCHLPLVEDCFPGVILEAAAMARPIISFDSGGITEQVTHPTSARLVTIGDVDAMTEHAIQLLSDPTTAERMGERARLEVTSKFSRQRHRAELDQLYDDLRNRRKPASADSDM